MRNTIDYEPKYSYQDDLDADSDAQDPFTDEFGDDPTRDLEVPPDEYGDELDKLAIDEASLETEQTFEDDRERIEDLDEDADDETKAA